VAGLSAWHAPTFRMIADGPLKSSPECTGSIRRQIERCVGFVDTRASRIIAPMRINLIRFLVFWGVTALSLWVADELFDGIAFQTSQSLFIAGLLLGIVNTFLKPLLVLLTLPLSVLTLGFFVLVINALMLLLVAWLVPGFVVAGFWSGFFVALFVSVFSFIVNSLIGYNRVSIRRIDRP
jgi:putative membrane protein